MSFPVHDWQFWAATAALVVSVWRLVRPFFDTRAEGEGCPGCSGCPPAKEAGGPKLVTLGRARPQRSSR